MPDVQGFWSTIGGLVAIIAIIGGFVMYRRGAKKPDGGVPLPPDPIIAPPLNSAPQLLPLLSLNPAWHSFQEGSHEVFQTIGHTGGCGRMEYGIKDNGTGPYETMISAIVRETGAMQPVYRRDTDEWCNDQWVPSGVFYWYPGWMRQWTQKVTGGCNPVYTEFPPGPKPALPAGNFTLDFTIRARNRFGQESAPLPVSLPIGHHPCGPEPETPTPAPCPKGTKKK